MYGFPIEVLIETTVAFIIGTLTTVLRLLLALNPLNTLAVDDKVMILATVLWWLAAGCFAFGGFYFRTTNAALTDEQRLALHLESERANAAKLGSIVVMVGWELVIAFIWTLKLSALFFFARLMGKVDGMRRQLQAATIFWALTLMAMLLYHHLRCVPFQRNWQIYPDPGDACQPAAALGAQYLLNVSDSVMDILLFGVALDFVRRMNLKVRFKHRMLLASIFSLGLVVVGLEVVVLYKLHTKGPMTDISANMWRSRKSYVSVIVTNIPSLYPDVLKSARRLRELVRSLRCRSATKSEISVDPPQIDLDMEQGRAVVRNSTAASPKHSEEMEVSRPSSTAKS
ncbi:hypothetical protein BC567DRAFT_213590 [Phyllosticta citribraziliensis]